MEKVTEKYRRKIASFDTFYFEKQKQLGNEFTMQEAFTHIAEINLWGSNESISGEGSTAIETNKLKNQISQLLEELNIKTLLDAPCGDFHWLGSLNLPIEKYIGIDIVKQNIDHLKHAYHNKNKYEFILTDICEDRLPKSDLILCRDCLVHFSFEDIFKAIENFKSSGGQYILTTTFTGCKDNYDIVTGDWRTLNLQQPPFNFPEPQKIIVEGCLQNNGLYHDKSLAVWELKEVKSVLRAGSHATWL